MGNWKKHYSSEHLAAEDVPDGTTPTITIKAVGNTELEGDKGKESKMLITFEPSPGFAKLTNKRTWVAAKTCGYCLAAMFGNDDTAWIGKRVTLQVETVMGDVPALRVKGSPDIAREIKIKVRQFGRGKATIALMPTGQTASA